MSSASAALFPGVSTGPYPERRDEALGWLDEQADRVVGVVTSRLGTRLRRARHFAKSVVALGPTLQDCSDAQMLEKAAELRALLRRKGLYDEASAHSFALVREAARRHLGKPHHEVQLMGGWVLLSGMICEMETGEGKTLTATLAASTAALAGFPVHVITVNDYLVARDAEEMGPVYRALGLDVGAIRQGMRPPERRIEYARDVTYCSNKELTFDYLRDRIAMGRMRTRVRLQLEQLAQGGSRGGDLVLRGLGYAIVDEADSVLADEARTPLIISGGGDIDPLEEQVYATAVELARQLEETRDFVLEPRFRSTLLTPEGEERLEELAGSLGGIWSGPHRRGELVGQALSALHLYVRDKDYLLSDENKVHIIDEYTGRVMPDRSWQRGLHQMIEAKEGCPISAHSEPLAQISYQRFFRRYLRLAGMTGTAQEVASELWLVYRMPVVRIPTHRPLRRRDFGSRVYAKADGKWAAVVARIGELHREGRPVLVGTRSVGASEHLSRLLDAEALAHRVLNARQDQEEADIVAEAGQVGRITVATNMAGRGTDIRLPREVTDAGGLHVIATERHESARIDRQLFGRCGRQGDPGSYEAIVCLEDELVRSHTPQLLQQFPGIAGASEGSGEAAATSRMRNLAVRSAQLRAERLHASMRRAMLKVDERVSSMLAFSGRGE